MPQPVQPPEIPAIIQSVTYKDAANLNSSSNGVQVSVPNQILPTEVPATPTSPETFTPESSSLKAQQSAVLLGPPISVGYSLQRIPVALPSQKREEGELGVPSGDKGARGQEGEKYSFTPGLNFAPLHNRPVTPTSPTPLAESPKPSAVTRSSSDVVASEEFSVGPSPLIPEELPSNSSSFTLQTQNVKRLVAQERGGEVREFDLSEPQPETQPLPTENQEVAPPPQEEREAAPQPPTSPQPGTTVPTPPVGTGGVIELTADRQEYDAQRQVVTAQGNVVLRFREALLDADRIEVNLQNRIIVAEGNVSLTRGRQVLRGERFEYYFVQDSGVILNARGEVYTPTSGTDLALNQQPNGSGAGGPPRPVSDRITDNQPLQGISNPGAYSFALGGGRNIQNVASPQTGGTLTQLRYEADRVDFEGPNAIATNVRISNDPFSPPELELRADTARFTRISPLVDEIVATRPRLVFDQGLEVPTFRNRITIDRREREPGLLNFGYDAEERGGVFVERNFEILNTPGVRFSLTPQYFVQKATFGGGGIIDPSVFGLRARLDAFLSPQTSLEGRLVLTSLDPSELEDELRASLRLRQTIGTTLPHTLTLESSYRNRLFNGSLGYQTVQSSIGAVLTSPVIPLGNTGIDLSYQASAQYINAETDRLDLLEPVRENDRISLGRYQATASLSRGFVLWEGQALPPTPTEGLRYTPVPVRPYLQLNADITGVTSLYSNGDNQTILSGTIGLSGQVGHFSRPYLDYTGFNISYSQLALNGLSPFLFDREVDTRVLSGGITQQIYGPFRAGFQTSFNLETGNEISTDYFVEYSRRTYNILLRYNPTLQLGAISFRINDFNWTGNPGLFDGSEIRPVVQGVTR